MHGEPLLPGKSLPLVVRAPRDVAVTASLQWVRANAAAIQDLASSAGVALIRGLAVGSAEAFRAVCHAIEPGLRNYTGGDSPRTGVADQVYTSTEYAPELDVYLHNELSYAGWSPRLVFFGCLQPAAQGGETPLADSRAVYREMPADIRRRFETRGVAYLQHLWDARAEPGIGKSWQETFETEDPAAAEDYLRESGMSWQWTDIGLRTRAPHAAVRSHPLSGEKCWFNQADQWHRDMGGVKTSFGGDGDTRFDPATAGEATLGNHVTYGDGSEIDVEDLRTVRRVAQAQEVAFPWQAGDVMVIDNLLAMHGRKPYHGARRVLVAMA